MAIVAGDVEKAKDIVQRYPVHLRETNLLGQTPFHLAASDSECLKVLIQALQPSDYDLLKQCDVASRPPICYAFSSSLQPCLNKRRGLRCRRCSCASSLFMLMRTECSIPVTMILDDFFRYGGNDVSLRCKFKFVKHLRRRRECLQKLALSSPMWTKADSEACHFRKDHTLDTCSTRAINILEKHGVRVPAALADSSWTSFDISGYHGRVLPAEYSVYHVLGDDDIAEIFYRNGFRDVDHGYTSGFTPLSMATADTDIRYVGWLVEHGAQLGYVLPEIKKSAVACSCKSISQSHTCAHLVARRVTYRLEFPIPMNLYSVNTLRSWAHLLYHYQLLMTAIVFVRRVGVPPGP